MKLNQSIAVVLVIATTSIASIWGYGKYHQHRAELASDPPSSSSIIGNAKFTPGSKIEPLVDFEKAATKAAPAVVHIKTRTKSNQVSANPNVPRNPFEDFFGDGFGDMFPGEGTPRSIPQQRGSGSGVLISADGYIVTNNHVVDKADELIATLNNKKDHKAKVIGTDPSTDLPVIKIEAGNLPYLTYANSDDVHLGQWILAIGYPLNLETTITSGIVSAKSR